MNSCRMRGCEALQKWTPATRGSKWRNRPCGESFTHGFFVSRRGRRDSRDQVTFFPKVYLLDDDGRFSARVGNGFCAHGECDGMQQETCQARNFDTRFKRFFAQAACRVGLEVRGLRHTVPGGGSPGEKVGTTMGCELWSDRDKLPDTEIGGGADLLVAC